jgi:hypothetical protein
MLSGFASLARGEPICVSGTLASYVALGSSGCSIGLNLLSGFETLPGINRSIGISPTDINITPLSNAGNIGLMFSLSSNASSGAILEAVIDYRISGSSYTAASISASGTSTAGNGAVTDIQDLCFEGSFGPDGVTGCSTGKVGTLLLLGNGSVSTAFAAAHSISITDDITFDSGGSGSANGAAGGVFTDRFTTSASDVPEPRTMSLFIAGALWIALMKFTNGDRRRLI